MNKGGTAELPPFSGEVPRFFGKEPYMDWLKSIFNENVSLARANPVGLAMMLAAVLIVIFAGKISAKLIRFSINTIKVIGLLICAGGALLAILG